MSKYLVLTSDGQTVTVAATGASIRDGALCFNVKGPEAENFVMAYAPGAWKFFGLLDDKGEIPIIEE